ncbi:MAG TPA: hypothetical protein VK530_05345 [Candidatus Acidoferrum sp.]|nr:hypothetical protein [Candidatus Acidoferrum sp.]
MTTVTREEAKKRFDELLANLPVAGAINITDAGKVVATLSAGPVSSPDAKRHSALDIKPASVGGFLKAFPDSDDDILGEMLDNKFDPNK